MSHHYTLLNLTHSATEAEILSAYRKLSLKCHPDKGGDATSFHRLSEAKDFCLKQLKLQAAAPPPRPFPPPPMRPQAHPASYRNAYWETEVTDLSSDLPNKPWKKFYQFVETRRRAKRREQARKIKKELERREHDIMAQARYYTDLQRKMREQGVKC